jgi:hypothetical protein
MLIKKIINNIKTDYDKNIISNSFILYDDTLGNNLKSDINYFNNIIKYNLYGDYEEEKIIENLYLKAKKIKNILERFVKILKKKLYKKYEFNKDLRFVPLKNYNNNEIVKIIENKTIYSFRTLDLIHLLKISLYNNENMFPIPLKLKNPYTNIYFKKHNLYNILIAFNNTNYILPEIVLNYYKSNFDIIKFKLKAYPLLKENAIDNYLKNGYISELYDYIITLCHDFRKETNYVLVKTTISIFKKARMVDIFKKTLSCYLKKKYLSNPLKKEYFENKCFIELKKIIKRHGFKREFLHLNNIQSIRYETSELINELNTLDIMRDAATSATDATSPTVVTDAISPNVVTNTTSETYETSATSASNNTINNIINNAMNDVSYLNETENQNTIISSNNNFIYRRRSTLYLPPINRNPFTSTNEIPRSPVNNNNLSLSNDIRNRLNFGFR